MIRSKECHETTYSQKYAPKNKKINKIHNQSSLFLEIINKPIKANDMTMQLPTMVSFLPYSLFFCKGRKNN